MTFRLSGTAKSVFWLVGTNYEDGGYRILRVAVAPRVLRASEAPAAVCAGGRRPAREPSAPRASLGASPRSPARPCHRPPAPRPGLSGTPAPSAPAVSVAVRGQCGRPLRLSNFARNSPWATSNHELASLQLQRLWAVSKSDRRKLCASFAWLAPVTARRHRGKAPRPAPSAQ